MMNRKTANHQICFSPNHCIRHRRDKLRMIRIVRIQKSDCTAVHHIQSRISRCAETSVLLMNDSNPLIFPCITVANIPRTICGSVVDKDNLQVYIGLIDNAVQSLDEIRGNIVNRHYNTDQSMILHLPAPYPLSVKARRRSFDIQCIPIECISTLSRSRDTCQSVLQHSVAYCFRKKR